MKKALLLSLSLSSLITTVNVNAEEVVTLKEDSNQTQVANSRKNDAVKFSIETGAKTDFWNPGLSKEDGQTLLKYDTEGLQLGYATLKAKIYNTDVFTVEKFSTLKSSDNQEKLLLEYKDDKKKESSLDGVKMSIQFVKILNYWFDTDFLDGFEYKYQTRNFIGKAELQDDALYWFGENPGILDTDYYKFAKGSELLFKTKFEDQRLLLGNNLFIGWFKSKWSKPTYIGSTTADRYSIIYPAKYEVQGVSIGIKAKSDNLSVNFYYDYGIDNNMYLNNDSNLKNTLSQDDIDLKMYALGLDLEHTYNIYSNNSSNLDFIIGGKLYYSSVNTTPKESSDLKKIDEEALYGVHTSLAFTF